MEKLHAIIRWCSAAAFLLMGIRYAGYAWQYNAGRIFYLCLTVLLCVLAYGLMKDRRWAARGAAYLFLFIALILPMGVFSPFQAGDDIAAGKQPAEVSHTLVWLMPLEMVLVALAYLLDKKRSPL